jgi:hypothetical protein
MFYPYSTDHFILAIFIGLLALAAFWDVREYRIPNSISLAIAGIFPAYAISAGLTAWPSHLVVGGGVFLVCLALFALRYIGGGDAKLISATALWAGPYYLVDFLLITTVVGGLMALLMGDGIAFFIQFNRDGCRGKGIKGPNIKGHLRAVVNHAQRRTEFILEGRKGVAGNLRLACAYLAPCVLNRAIHNRCCEQHH